MSAPPVQYDARAVRRRERVVLTAAFASRGFGPSAAVRMALEVLRELDAFDEAVEMEINEQEEAEPPPGRSMTPAEFNAAVRKGWDAGGKVYQPSLALAESLVELMGIHEGPAIVEDQRIDPICPVVVNTSSRK